MRTFINYNKNRLNQHEGKVFERLIISCANREKIAIKKADPPLKQAPGKSGKTIFWREKSGADFTIGYQNKAILFDAKSLKQTKFMFSNMRQNQITELKYWNQHGFKTGYLVNFRTLNKVCWIDISCLLQLKPRESIQVDNLPQLGTEFTFSLKKLFI